MTPKQEIFVCEYIIDYNATRSYKKAFNLKDDKSTDNIAAVEGFKLLRNPKIMAILEAKKAARTKNLGITAEFVLGGLKEIAIKCSKEEELTDKNGKSIGKFKLDSAGSNKAYELLGKHLKLFTEKIETENININHEVSKMSDNEILEELKQLEMNKE